VTSLAAREALFAPLHIRELALPNRFVMSPMNRNAAPGGIPGDDIAQFYCRRVTGEAGLLFTGGAGIDHPAAVGVYADRPCNVPTLEAHTVEGWKHVLAAVHGAGGKLGVQLWHQGVMRTPGTGYHPEAPSCRPSGIWGPTGRRTRISPAFVARLAEPTAPLSDAQIVDVVEAYGRSARTAVELGFDVLGIHGSNGYLVDSFLWGETNRRADRWGGNRRERTRFAVEVVKAVRAAAGERTPIFFRFSQWKHHDLDARLAASPAELEEVLGPIADAGVDVFDASQFDFDVPEFPGSEMNLAGWARKLTGRLSMTVGSVGISRGLYDDHKGDPRAHDNLDAVARRFEGGEFDLIALGRSLLQDPGWVRKARLGEPFVPYTDAALRTTV
jgi:2,4-dienoyl-CoA reductase-like NADH-dependent reductase (Old Yellow Enzyme family)